MKKLSLFDKILICIAITLCVAFLSMKIANTLIKQTMKRFPEVYTEESLNKYGLTKKNKQ